ncbi:hypothetical protein T069G_10173 [Trichoderma breve]|uniref:Rhodopsin domain-containing protein n=1 Tax=Trichoderma breve TaxID=2034170 RepID=A0A9W9E4A3_9HYPO|nr:hypothetical protein T069G_10173 [Trichoderma breve]KAJ4856805.1 hypothetical protein T069G_10173 [Trichoderma breve]
MFSNFLTCSPLYRYWSPAGCSLPDDLLRADASIKFATSTDIVADVLTMILPLHLLRNLTISRPHTFGLAILFSLGAIIVAIALVRLVQVTKATGDSAEDPTTTANGPVLLSMWSHIESTVSMIVATLPAFRFLRKRKPTRRERRTNILWLQLEALAGHDQDHGSMAQPTKQQYRGVIARRSCDQFVVKPCI